MEPKTLSVPDAGRTYFDLRAQRQLRSGAAWRYPNYPDRAVAARAGGGDGTQAGGGRTMSKRKRCPELVVRLDGDGLYLEADGVRIAKRQSRRWLAIEPGWSVSEANHAPDGSCEIMVDYQQPRAQ